MLDLKKISAAVRYEGGISRRLFLAYGAALAALPQLGRQVSAADRKVSFSSDPFALGVASGDPDSQSVVLWTRLAPQPTELDAGMKPEAVNVAWELADDEGMKNIVSKGQAVASPELGHAVHIEVTGLHPDRWYFYRFHAGDATSPVGRTRTLPAPDAKADKLRFAFASCQHYEQGLFTAYQQMAKDAPDLVFHLGDYIYEYAGKDKLVRKHTGKEIETVAEYRARHALYRADPDLRAMHAVCPWFVTWDDHEVDNNYANDISEQKGVDPGKFLERRAHAYQAYYEAMPLRAAALPKGPHMRLYRKAAFGQLAEFYVLDTRQYRTDQPNNDKPAPINAAALDPHNTLLGKEQREWLQNSLTQSPATWNVLAQQVMMGMAAIKRGTGLEQDVRQYSMDQWPGYANERLDFMKFIADRKIRNPVVLTGDIHSNWANDLRIDDRQTDTPVVASEFVGTSITSGGNGTQKPKHLEELLSANPFVKYHTTEKGYVRCDITPKDWKSTYIAIEDVTKPNGKIVERAAFVVEAGQPGIKPA